MADSQPVKRIKTTTSEETSNPVFRFQENPPEVLFSSHCKLSGDLESLYRQGMVAYFTDFEYCEKGLDIVRVAAQNGHAKSMYAFAMIVLMSNDATRIGFLRTQELDEALGYLRLLRNQTCVLRCRNEVAEFVRYLTWSNMRSGLVMAIRDHLCKNIPCTNTWTPRIGSWCSMVEDDDENDPNMCESCRWDHEVEDFSNMI